MVASSGVTRATMASDQSITGSEEVGFLRADTSAAGTADRRPVATADRRPVGTADRRPVGTAECPPGAEAGMAAGAEAEVGMAAEAAGITDAGCSLAGC